MIGLVMMLFLLSQPAADAVLPGFTKDLNDHRICAAWDGHWQNEPLNNTCPDPACKNIVDSDKEFWRKEGWHCTMAGATWLVTAPEEDK